MILAESKQLFDFPFTSKSTLVKLSKKLRFCYKQGNKSNLMLIFWVQTSTLLKAIGAGVFLLKMENKRTLKITTF